MSTSDNRSHCPHLMRLGRWCSGRAQPSPRHVAKVTATAGAMVSLLHVSACSLICADGTCSPKLDQTPRASLSRAQSLGSALHPTCQLFHACPFPLALASLHRTANGSEETPQKQDHRTGTSGPARVPFPGCGAEDWTSVAGCLAFKTSQTQNYLTSRRRIWHRTFSPI